MSDNRTISRVLLCRPDNFDVDYIINPYMQPHSVDKAKALRQWKKLVSALQTENIDVEIIEQAKGVPDMVFATDQGIVRGNEVLLANFRFPERKKERPYYRKWFEAHGYIIRTLSDVFPFEGGDTLFFGDMLLVGTGFRASVSSCEELSHTLDIDVLPLRLTDAKYYHLDTALLVLDSKTALYYPPAFSLNSKNLLRTVVRNLHELTQEQAESFAANSFVSGDTVFTQAGIPGFKKKLESFGKKVIEVDLGEFKKAGGGIHCLINALS